MKETFSAFFVPLYVLSENSGADMDAVRQEVRAFCSGGKGEAVAAERGLFSLTVPTGGGKTLASLLFALSHAKYHNEHLAEARAEFEQNGEDRAE